VSESWGFRVLELFEILRDCKML